MSVSPGGWVDVEVRARPKASIVNKVYSAWTLDKILDGYYGYDQ